MKIMNNKTNKFKTKMVEKIKNKKIIKIIIK
jgi:hypothetical protein